MANRTIYFTDSFRRPSDSNGYPLAPEPEEMLTLRSKKWVESYGNNRSVEAYNSIWCDYNDSSPTLGAKLHISCYFVNLDYSAEMNAELYLRIKVSIYAGGQTVYEQYHYPIWNGNPVDYIYTSQAVGAAFYYYSRANMNRSGVFYASGQWASMSASGVGVNAGISLDDIPLAGTAYTVRITYETIGTNGNWTNLGKWVEYQSYAPFYLQITPPSTFYGNALNTFGATIGANFESVFSYGVSAGGTPTAPVRNENYPYITSGQQTTSIYWLPQLQAENAPENPADYTLMCGLRITDPGDSNFKIMVSYVTVTGSISYLENDDNQYVTATATHVDPSGLYNTYGYLLKNTDAKLTSTITVTPRYGARYYVSYCPFVQSSSQLLRSSIYVGNVPQSFSVTQEIPDLDTVYTALTASLYSAYVGSAPAYHGHIVLDSVFNATVLDYFVPTFPNLAIHRCESDGTVNDNGAYCKIEWATSIMPIANQNSKQLVISHPAGRTTIDLATYYQTGFLVVAASTEIAYDITFTLNDDLNSIQRTLRLSTAGVIMDWLYGGKGVSFGKVAERQDAVEISTDWTLIFEKALLSGVDLNVWMEQIAARMKGVEQFISNLGSTTQFEVTFYNQEDIVDRQWVLSGYDAVDPGVVPEKESTPTTSYGFVGWALTNGATTADPNALLNITDIRNIYAAFSETTRTYSVYFYNGTDLLETKNNVQYLGTGTYTGSTPVGDGTFIGFAPTGTYIYGNTDCYATFYDDTEIEDDWAAIVSACYDGTYVSKYKVGQYKSLDLGTEGVVHMQCVGMKMDQRADRNAKAAMTWISKELLATTHRYNPTVSHHFEYFAEPKSFVHSGDVETVGWFSMNKGQNKVAYAKWEVVATGRTSGNGGQVRYGARGVLKSGDTLEIKIDGTVTDNWTSAEITSTTTAHTNETAYFMGEKTFIFEYTFTTATDTVDDNYVEATFYASIFSVGAEINSFRLIETSSTERYTKVYNNGTGCVGGWKESELRSYLQTSIKSLLPDALLMGIKPVKKYTCGKSSIGSVASFADEETTDDLWIPSKAELFGHSEYEKAGPVYAANNSSRIKTLSGTAKLYNLRSPATYSSTDNSTQAVSASGSSSSGLAYSKYGVCLGFCT